MSADWRCRVELKDTAAQGDATAQSLVGQQRWQANVGVRFTFAWRQHYASTTTSSLSTSSWSCRSRRRLGRCRRCRVARSCALVLRCRSRRRLCRVVLVVGVSLLSSLPLLPFRWQCVLRHRPSRAVLLSPPSCMFELPQYFSCRRVRHSSSSLSSIRRHPHPALSSFAFVLRIRLRLCPSSCLVCMRATGC